MTDILVASLQSNAQLFTVSAVGVIAGQAGLLHTKFLRDASRLSLAIFSPAFVLAMTEYYGVDQLWRWLPLPILSFITIFLGALMAKAGAMLMGLDPDDTCMAVVSTAFVNTGAVPFVLVDGLLKTWEPLQHAQPGTRERAYAMIMVYTVPWYFMIYSFGLQYMNRHATVDSDDEDEAKDKSVAGSSPREGDADKGVVDSDANHMLEGNGTGASTRDEGGDEQAARGPGLRNTDGKTVGGIGVRDGDDGAVTAGGSERAAHDGGQRPLVSSGSQGGGCASIERGDGGSSRGRRTDDGSTSRDGSGPLDPVVDPLLLPLYPPSIASSTSEFELSSRPSEPSTSTRPLLGSRSMDGGSLHSALAVGGEAVMDGLVGASGSAGGLVRGASCSGGEEGRSADGGLQWPGRLGLFQGSGNGSGAPALPGLRMGRTTSGGVIGDMGVDGGSSNGGGVMRTSSGQVLGEQCIERDSAVPGLGPLYIKKLPLGRASLDSSAADRNRAGPTSNPGSQAFFLSSADFDAGACNGHGKGAGSFGALAIDVEESTPRVKLFTGAKPSDQGAADRGGGGSSRGKGGRGRTSDVGQGGVPLAPVTSNRSVQRVLKKVWTHTKKALLRIWHHKMVSPPNIALAIGVTIASTRFLKYLFLAPNAPFRFCINAATLLAGGSVPLSTLILAGSLSQMLTSYMHRRKQRQAAAGQYVRGLTRLESMPITPLAPTICRSHGYFAYWPFARSVSLVPARRGGRQHVPLPDEDPHENGVSTPLRGLSGLRPRPPVVHADDADHSDGERALIGPVAMPPAYMHDNDVDHSPHHHNHDERRLDHTRGDGHPGDHERDHHDHSGHHQHTGHHGHHHLEHEIDMPSAKLTFLICFLRLIAMPIVMMAIVMLAERLGMMEGSGTKLTLMLVLLLECCSPSAQTLIILYQVNGQSQAAGKLAFIYLVMYVLSVFTITVYVLLDLYLIRDVQDT